MNIHVRLLQYASKTFTYQVPEQWQPDIASGVLVQVPLGTRIVPAVVEEIARPSDTYAFALKSIHAIFPFPADPYYLSFIQKISDYYQTDQLVFLRRVQLFLTEQDEHEYVHPEHEQQLLDAVVFTDEQEAVYRAIVPSVQEQKHETFVLHGVTGSGKTEVYKKLASQALQQGKAVMLLFPEVTLALRFQQIFTDSFNAFPVIGFHSASTAKQKRLLWQLLLEKKPVIIIGVHLPVLLPVAHLGLIIVDEEHDHGYQEKKHPKLHTRDMAILKASLYGVPIVLGSATPSIQSLWNVGARGWKLLQMTRRFAGMFPRVRMVSLKKGERRKYGWLHNELYLALEDRLARGEQAIVFLNRRGYSFFVQCPCSFVFECHQCSVSLTLHQDGFLVCHYCGYKELLALECPMCKASSDEFLKQGIGTQQVVAMLQKLFPAARIARADLDTTSKKKSWANTVDDMYEKKIDILVGTQSITKGYHFPGVTLVGVLWADLNLHFPIYNAAETTLQQLIQVAGRAGRQSNDSLVIVQAFDSHAIFDFIDETKYLKFYEYEISNRADAAYPPCGHIAEIEFKAENQSQMNQEGIQVASICKDLTAKYDYKIEVLGPVPSLVYKVKKIYSQKILLKSSSRQHLMHIFRHIRQLQLKSGVYFTIDPVA